jgi:hypothetical protein
LSWHARIVLLERTAGHLAREACFCRRGSASHCAMSVTGVVKFRVARQEAEVERRRKRPRRLARACAHR